MATKQRRTRVRAIGMLGIYGVKQQLARRKKADRAIELLKLAASTLEEIARYAGDDPQWNTGGDYFTAYAKIREFLGRVR